jgi:hypothetical protein
LKLKKLEVRRDPDESHLTNATDQNIIQSDSQRINASFRAA